MEKTFQRKLPHILNVFSKSGNNLLKDFHSVIERRCQEKGHGIARINMLGVGLRNYEHVFNDAATAMIAHINERQRDINREFVPVVTNVMQTAYDLCVEECGQGSFRRMKAAMESFVDVNKNTMFQQACQEVKNRLDDMCEEVRKAMLDRVEGVFNPMKRDYLSLVGGVDVGQVQIPRGERAAKRELDEVICLMDEEFKKVAEADLEELRKSDLGGEEVAGHEGQDERDDLEFEDEGEDQQDEEDMDVEEDDDAEPAQEPVELDDEE